MLRSRASNAAASKDSHRIRYGYRAYHRILNGFLCFVDGLAEPLSVTVIQNWLRNRVAVWPLPVVEYHARLVDRFLDRMVLTEALPSNPLGELRRRSMYNKQRKISNMQLIIRALLNESHSLRQL